MPQRRERNAPLLTEEELIERLPALERGIREFNEGLFFQAHETWEEIWIVSPWPVRNFLQGLIQVAAAFVHLARREYPGTHRLLREAIGKLADFPSPYLGIDSARLVAEGRRCLEAILALGEEGLGRFDRSLLPKIHVSAQPPGREPEQGEEDASGLAPTGN